MKTREELLALLSEALGWLDDYDLRMSGTASICARIEEAITEENSDE